MEAEVVILTVPGSVMTPVERRRHGFDEIKEEHEKQLQATVAQMHDVAIAGLEVKATHALGH